MEVPLLEPRSAGNINTGSSQTTFFPPIEHFLICICWRSAFKWHSGSMVILLGDLRQTPEPLNFLSRKWDDWFASPPVFFNNVLLLHIVKTCYNKIYSRRLENTE